MDPRVKTSPLGLKQQFDLSMQAYDGIAKARTLADETRKLIADLEKSNPNSPSVVKLKAILNGENPRPGTPVIIAQMPLSRLPGAFAQLLDLLQDADVTPSSQAFAAARDLQMALLRIEAQLKTGKYQ